MFGCLSGYYSDRVSRFWHRFGYTRDSRQRDHCNFAVRGSTRVVVDRMNTWIEIRNEKNLEHPIPVQKIYILKSVVGATGATVDFFI